MEYPIAKMPKGVDMSMYRCIGFPSGANDEASYNDAKKIADEFRPEIRSEIGEWYPYDEYLVVRHKQIILGLVKEYLESKGVKIRIPKDNWYFAYEMTTLWLWNEFLLSLHKKEQGCGFTKTFCNKYKKQIASVYAKYPKITSMFIMDIDLLRPNNVLSEFIDKDNANWENDNTIEN